MVARTTPALSAVSSTAPVSSTVTDAASVRAWLDAAATQYRGPGAANAMRAIVLATISPRACNVLLIGPPGTAKTAMANAWATATGARFLGATLSPWTQDAELLGPVDLVALAAGRLERARSPSRPSLLDADVVLLDEFPRAAPGIRAMVMSALADRVTPTGDKVPAHVVIAAANTRLTSEEDAAVVDRFALRVEVPRLMSAPDLRHVMTREVPTGGVAPTSSPLPPLAAGVVAALRAHAALVDVPTDIADALTAFALALRQPAPSGASYPDVSERRWILATRLLQASAALDGRTAVDWVDLTSTLPTVLDDGPEARAVVAAALASSIPRWVAGLIDLDQLCKLAVERARRVGSVVDARPGDGDAHARVEEEWDAALAALKPYGAAVVARADTRIDDARDAVISAYADGQAAYAATRKRAR